MHEQTIPLILLALLPLLGLIALIRSTAAAIERKLDRLNAKIDLIAKAGGVDLEPALSERVQMAIARGRKIEAIKLYREETGVGLRDAKETIERKML